MRHAGERFGSCAVVLEPLAQANPDDVDQLEALLCVLCQGAGKIGRPRIRIAQPGAALTSPAKSAAQPSSRRSAPRTTVRLAAPRTYGEWTFQDSGLASLPESTLVHLHPTDMNKTSTGGAGRSILPDLRSSCVPPKFRLTEKAIRRWRAVCLTYCFQVSCLINETGSGGVTCSILSIAFTSSTRRDGWRRPPP